MWRVLIKTTMDQHRCSVFTNSCVKIPVDPISKMPKTANERLRRVKQTSVDSISTVSSISTADRDAEKLKDFYKSIPDYNDINHLPAEQFYSTLRSLREKKKVMLEIAVEHIDECNRHHSNTIDSILVETDFVKTERKPVSRHTRRTVRKLTRESVSENREYETINGMNRKKSVDSVIDSELSIKVQPVVKRSLRKVYRNPSNLINDDLDIYRNVDKENIKTDRPKRNQSACSISWSDAKLDSKTDVDKKFDQFFDGIKYSSPHKVEIGEGFTSQSMPSSPLRGRKSRSPKRRGSITVPKPFKMTERDEDDRISDELRSLRKSFSDDMLHKKCKRRNFKANPVPIESRIPLYDKILEDQAMRRAITKINCEAELRAQMKPFSFTTREEKSLGVCDRINAAPKKKKKRFKARPFPKNLFSNYFYDKMKENEFFRGMNKRIRAEEMLKSAALPSNMAARERSRLSTPGAHSDLPIDPSPGPGATSTTSSDRRRCSSPIKGRRRKKDDFITTSPQPFHFNTAHRAAKKMEEATRKIYQGSKSSESIDCNQTGDGSRAYSALDLRTVASGRSNLAAVLRAEAVRRKFEMDAAEKLSEQRRKSELKQRDRLFRSKPSWHLVKNNCEEDIAMRLQTRRDEERLRREEFLHEMELMYGRVLQQPMLFERYYAPQSLYAPTDSIQLQLSPRKNKKKSFKSSKSNSPSRSRKVSINEITETFNGHVSEFLNRIDDDLTDSVLNSDSGKL